LTLSSGDSKIKLKSGLEAMTWQEILRL
jgi:hypothetical protein